MKKYELTQETIQVDDLELYRIKALIDFGQVSAGELGGFVETEFNLSHEGNCWIHDDSGCFGKAAVSEDASVSENSWVHGNATVSGSATVSGRSWVSGSATISGNTEVRNRSWISGSRTFSCFGKIWD